MSTRKLNVQTPGEVVQTTDQNAGAAVTGQSNEDTAGSAAQAQPDPNADLLAKLAALEAENAALKAKATEKDRITAEDKALDASAAKVGRGDRAKYLTMHSSQVDAKTLVAPVLCKDGWLAPDQSEQPHRR